jgi:proline dehydrogenase
MGIARRMAMRFIAGETLEEALATVTRLNQRGIFTTLDHLGEHVSKSEEALRATDTYIEIIQRLHEEGVRSNCSLKLSQLGLQLDYELCLANMRCIATRAAEFGTMVRIDMEESQTIDDTIRIYQTLRDEGLDNIGLVLQSYLYRSEDDLNQLLERSTHIRLCKGAYKEPDTIAFTKKEDIDASFDHLTTLLIEGAQTLGSTHATSDGKVPPVPAIATHDKDRIDHATQIAAEKGLPNSALEFQMLNGIRSDLQVELSEAGYPVRVYVPYGTEWYPYVMRRMAERPANLILIGRNLFKRRPS